MDTKKVVPKAVSFIPIKNLPKRKCQTCGVEFQPKRTDQKYCCQECRNGYHNASSRALLAPFKKTVKFCQNISINAKNPDVVADTLNILLKNREILHSLYHKGEKEVTHAQLKAKGFVNTSITDFNREKRINYVFDYGVIVKENTEKIIIVEKA
jgi:hypothetical protein